MPKYQIVIESAAKAHAFERKQYVSAFTRAGVPVEKAIKLADERLAQTERRKKGAIHAELDDACPDGLPNCRNCGDPAHKAECEAAGHCPDCGTKHGIAPDRVLTANGFALKAV